MNRRGKSLFLEVKHSPTAFRYILWKTLETEFFLTLKEVKGQHVGIELEVSHDNGTFNKFEERSINEQL
jgi:hypothetical protein